MDDKKKKEIYCEHCSGVIKDKYDLIVGVNFFTPIAIHNDCFLRSINGSRGLFLADQPLNGFWSNVFAVFVIAFFAIGLILFSFGHLTDFWYFIFIPIITIVYRLMSYLNFERHL
ncbi:hypothetical protein [Bacillus sp. FJAT-45066]|uniref:hypothetical protein n=1 Tax=Bacillus sp. FJAT-45066 TaxID=2011010 RepID=UPI000BB7D9EF|nr:hypothetical protein [Bacillus sp. FJAT-45066]